MDPRSIVLVTREIFRQESFFLDHRAAVKDAKISGVPISAHGDPSASAAPISTRIEPEYMG